MGDYENIVRLVLGAGLDFMSVWKSVSGEMVVELNQDSMDVSDIIKLRDKAREKGYEFTKIEVGTHYLAVRFRKIKGVSKVESHKEISYETARI